MLDSGGGVQAHTGEQGREGDTGDGVVSSGRTAKVLQLVRM